LTDHQDKLLAMLLIKAECSKRSVNGQEGNDYGRLAEPYRFGGD
jgi:hypothetical protein